MLGVNDVAEQRLTTSDARELATFVNRRGIPRVSAWSLNRDSQCGGAFARTGVVSNTCSGVAQNPLEFTHIFGELRGTKTARQETEGPTPATQQASKAAADNPATSPYPIWRPTAAYASGFKVVWQGQIYQSSWWNQGTVPGSVAADSPTGPWQPIGPVPAGSHAPKLVPLVSAALPAVVADHRLPRGRPRELRRYAVPGPLVHPRRTALGRTAVRSERALGTPLQVPR